MKKVEYIRYGKIEETLMQLRQGICSGGISTLTGQGGVGKSRMLEQLILEEPRVIEPDQIVLVRMVQPNRRLPGKDRIASPPAIVQLEKRFFRIETCKKCAPRQ